MHGLVRSTTSKEDEPYRNQEERTLCTQKEQETTRGPQKAYKSKEQHGLGLLTEEAEAANYYYPYRFPLFPHKKQENGEGNEHLIKCTERSQILNKQKKQ